jgi:hypothetical protein
MKSFRYPIFAIFVSVGLFSVGACSSDDSGDHAEGDGDHTHDDPPEECEAISSACHDVDALSDQAKECHDISHENVADACADALDSCVAHCGGLSGGGGAGGADH